MTRKFYVVVILLLFLTPKSFAGFYSSSYSRESGRIAVAVQIKDEGIFNLIISANFLRKPQGKKIYKSDEYEHLMDRLQVEWRGIALHKVLESKELRISDLINLKKSIQSVMEALTEQLKKKLVPGKNIEVVFSLSDFFLLEPRDK